jgi:hypothetical protein
VRAAPRRESPPSVGQVANNHTSVKVVGVCQGLDSDDVKDAFNDECGKVVSCELVGDTALLIFEKASDASAAVESCDMGQLNGHSISVKLVHDGAFLSPLHM